MSRERSSSDPRSRTVTDSAKERAVPIFVLLAIVLLLLPSSFSAALADCVDNDGDGYGFPGDPSCPNGPEVDCDDTNGTIYPGAREVCDGVSNDCDHPNWPSTFEWTERVISESAMAARSVFAADVDGDDDLDVLSALRDDNKVAWYERTAGDGSVWIEHVISTSAIGARSVIAADVDGDDDVDVLSASVYDDKVAWYENAAGDGSVWVERVISTAFERPYSVFAIDLDGDGDVDAASASAFDDTVAWHENTAGDGSVWVAHVISTSADYAESVFVADVDGDHDMDVLSASSMNDTVRWYENVFGDGSYWVEQSISAFVDQATSVFAADVDGDEDLDVLTASNDVNGIAWYENIAGNGLGWIEHPVSTSAVNPESVFGADMDGDGDLDVLSAATGKVSWHENSNGDGSIWIEHVLSESGIGWFESVFAADLDGDEYLDVFSAFENVYGDSRIAWSDWDPFDGDHDGDGLAVCAGDCDDAAPTCADDCETDLDGDGTSDCADTCVDADGDGWGTPGGAGDECAGVDCDDDDPNNWISCDTCVDSDGDSFFTGCDTYSTIDGPDCEDADPNNWISCGSCSDADGDGFFLGCDAYSTIDGPDCDDANGDVYPGAPEICDGVNNDCDDPMWPSLVRWSFNVVSPYRSSYPVDVDGDGDLDVLQWRYPETIYWQENVTGFGLAWIEHLVASDGGSSILSTDFDSDDDLDIIAVRSGVIVWYENGEGDGSEWVVHEATGSTNVSSVIPDDVDGDGDVDFVAFSPYFQKVSWYENPGVDGSNWIDHRINPEFNHPVVASTTFSIDLDGDGDRDLLMVKEDFQDEIKIYWNPGTGDVPNWLWSNVSWDDNIYSLSVGDMDGDGDVDLLTTGQYDYGGTSRILWFENLGNGYNWAGHTVKNTNEWVLLSAVLGDMDGDNDLDVLAPTRWFENPHGNGTDWLEHVFVESDEVNGSVFSVDVDGDADIDVLSAVSESGTLAWYENATGDGTELTEHVISNAISWADSVTPTDLNGDGLMDVLFQSSGMIVWYYQNSLEGDEDGDGLAECAGDCDDENASCTTDCTDLDQDGFCVTHDCDDGSSSTFPGAPEANDGADNQCPGDEGHGLIDEIEGDSGFHDPDDKAEYSWQAQPGATQYEVVRFPEPADPVDCAMFTTADTFVIDPEEPPRGLVFNYLVRALAPFTGSWGQDSSGVERTNVCP